MKVNKRILIVVLLLTATAVGLVQVFLIPPFQDPDEIQHFLYSALYAYTPRQMETLETRLLELLKEYKWFHFVGIGPGWENIKKISDISFVFHFDPGRESARKTFFHFLYGNILKISGITEVLTAFYFLRFVSTFFFLVVLFLISWFFRTYFPGMWEYYLIGFLLVFQLMTIMNSVNYDVLMVLFGSVFFIFAYRYVQREKKTDLAVLLIAASVAALTKLAGIMFFLYLFILICMTVKWDRKRVRNFFFVLLLVVFGFCWMNYLFPGRFFNLYSVIFNVWGDLTGSLAATGERVFRLSLFDSMVDSFYFYAGWMGFKLSEFWYLVLKIFLLFSIIGIFSGLLGSATPTYSRSDRCRSFGHHLKKVCFFCFLLQDINKRGSATPTKEGPSDHLSAHVIVGLEKKWLLYSLIVCALHTFSIWFYYGSRQIVQGRYLYPVIIPIIILVYSGLRYLQQWFRLKRDYILIVYIIFQVVLVVFAVTRIISVYYLEIASPHPGF